MKKNLLKLLTLVAGVLILNHYSYSQNGIISIDPNEAMQATSVSVTIILDADAVPPLPPEDLQPESVTIGDLEGTNVNRSDNTTVTADFEISSGMATGTHDVSVAFDMATFTLSNGFEVTDDGIFVLMYVDAENGSDTNSGLDWNNAKQTIYAANR